MLNRNQIIVLAVDKHAVALYLVDQFKIVEDVVFVLFGEDAVDHVVDWGEGALEDEWVDFELSCCKDWWVAAETVAPEDQLLGWDLGPLNDLHQVWADGLVWWFVLLLVEFLMFFAAIAIASVVIDNEVDGKLF